ncbi:TetR/AcrR family transcriptional regulator [Motiliproteus coralliicola]|uniref:TetR/AcrR family transcriptional regulator n=1 Tax=Motiliproteus coralliicola TaxID=2283196 RepID=A0A369WAH9_9GAMM|nr:TetR/AcrR family transcriptional regulator [Motiliproteus coralliicola]RDE18812.1 TetR/AcrR family transcriptional regulator [Motiliproteus coralliicola]
MAATAKFDRQEAIQKATELFWTKGFHATSMRNIQQAIDMRPGSIYACFGSKEGLFSETLQHYANASKERLLSTVAAASSPLQGLQQFIQEAVVSCRGGAPSSMCMLVKTVSELTDENADLLAEAKLLLRQMEAAFAAILSEAQVQGELRQDLDPDQVARYLQMQMMGLRAYRHVNEDLDQIDRLIEDIFSNLR